MNRPVRPKIPATSIMVHRLLGIIILLFFFQSPARAQETVFKSETYALKHYTAETGLPQNSIKSIVRDDAGFYWLATEDGLTRFDGQHFHVFNTSNSKLGSNRIVQSFRGLSDGLPFFSSESGIALQVSHGEITKASSYEKEAGQPGRRDIAATSYLIAFELSNRHIYKYFWKGSVLPVSAGSYFVCDSNNVAYFQKGKQLYSQPAHSTNFPDYFTIGGNLYFFDRQNANIMRIDRNGRHKVAIIGDLSDSNNGSDFPADLEVLWNAFSEALLISSRGKIYSVDIAGRDKFDTRLLLEGFDTSENNIISSFYDRASGLLLLGSHTKGLFVFKRKQFYAFKNSGGFSFHEQSLYKNRYIITNFGAYDIDSKTDTHLPAIDRFKGWNPFSTNNGYVFTARIDTLFLFNQENAQLVGKWRIGDNVSISYVDLDGNLWLGYRGGGLRKLDMKTLKWTSIRIAGQNAHISFFQQQKSPDARTNLLWVGTNKGLYRLALPGYHAEKLKNFEGDQIRSLYLSQTKGDPEIWGTIFGKGLFLIKNNRVTLFPTDQKKHLTSAHCIREDKNGFFWIPTNKGLFQIHGNDLRTYSRHPTPSLYYLYYDYESGFPTNEFNGGCIPCALMLPNGSLSMPSISGLVHFEPSTIQPQLPDKTLLIDRIEYNGKRISYADTLRLGSDFEFVKFSVSTPYFGHPNNVQIDYRLSSDLQKGSWLPVREGGEIFFNGLGSGQYVLSIRKLNGFGVHNYTIKRLTFSIMPKWHETWWFRTLFVALLILAAYSIFKRRTRGIKKQNEDLERAVTERTAALKESQNELGRQLNIQAHLIASITHDVRAPLKYVTQASGQITKLNEMGQHAMLNEVGNALEQSLIQMTNFLDNLLSYVKTTLYHNKVEVSAVDLSDLVTQKLKLFEKVFLLYKNEVFVDVPAGLTVRSNPELLSVVIHNLIDNASKYGRNGQIRIISNTAGSLVHLIVADSGKGIDPEIREWFNDPAATHSDSYGNASPKGFGLVIVKEVARLINLSVFVDNHDGCEFQLVFDTTIPAGTIP